MVMLELHGQTIISIPNKDFGEICPNLKDDMSLPGFNNLDFKGPLKSWINLRFYREQKEMSSHLKLEVRFHFQNSRADISGKRDLLLFSVRGAEQSIVGITQREFGVVSKWVNYLHMGISQELPNDGGQFCDDDNEIDTRWEITDDEDFPHFKITIEGQGDTGGDDISTDRDCNCDTRIMRLPIIGFAVVLDEDPDRDGIGTNGILGLPKDNSPEIYNPGQEDIDSDGVGDVSDNCPVYNPDQSDWNNNTVGDACDDSDGDLIFDATDNCRLIPNRDQANLDGDELGDLCDSDADGDNVDDENDNCLQLSNPDQADIDGDGMGDLCDPIINTEGVVDNIVDQIEDMDISSGIVVSLSKKLNTASNSCASGNRNAALGKLRALINEINAQRGKKLSESEASHLSSQVQRIIDAIVNGDSDCGDADLRKFSQVTTTSAMEVFPNPTIGLVHLSNSPADVVIYNALGQLIARRYHVDKVDLSSHSPGIYFIAIDSDNSRSMHKVIRE